MKLVESMTIKELYLGDIEGKNEFNLDNEKRVEETYLNIKNIDSEFINNNKYYIYGHKGTGKTSLLRYVEYKVKKKKNQTITILFKEIKQDTLIYSTFKNLLAQVKDKNSAAIAFWQWFLLSITIEEIFPNYKDKTDLIFNTNNGIFRILSGFLVSIVKGLSVKYGNADINGELSFSDLTLNETSDIFAAGQKIRKLENYIRNNLNTKLYVLIDELETSTLSTSYEEDAILIKNLILTVENLNNLSTNLTLITAVRTEVLNNIFTAGDEINKLLESKGEEIKWTYDNYGLEHPLIKMIIKKIRYSMKEYSQVSSSKIEKATNKEIFERWFPNKLLKDINGNNAKFLLHNTWIKPRDLVRFLQIMQDHAVTEKYFTRSHYDKTVKEYSTKAWTELKEELISIISKDKINILEKVFANYFKTFSYPELIARFNEKSNLKLEDVENIINILYEIGFIGNNYWNERKKRFVYRYSYRGEKTLDDNERIEIHRGLWMNFSLKDNKASYVNVNGSNDYSDTTDSMNDMKEKLRELGIK